MYTGQKRQGDGIVCNGRSGRYRADSWQWHSWELLDKNQVTNKKQVDVIVGVGYSLPSQANDTNEFFSEEPRDVSKSTALVLMGDFNLPEINWKHHTTGTARVWWSLKNLDSFVELVLREPTQKDALPDLLLVNRISWAKWRLGVSLPQWPWSNWIKVSLHKRKVAAKLQLWTWQAQTSGCWVN